MRRSNSRGSALSSRQGGSKHMDSSASMRSAGASPKFSSIMDNLSPKALKKMFDDSDDAKSFENEQMRKRLALA